MIAAWFFCPGVLMRFIHCADLHLDSPLHGLDDYEGAPLATLRGATRTAFGAIVDLALKTPVDFVLIAGDVYDGDWPDFNTGLFFAQQLRRLDAAGIRVFLVHGNHDALSRITRSLPLPANTHVFRADVAETVLIEALGVAIHGQSFATPAVTCDLAADFPAARPGLLNIGLLHTALAGSEGHAPYAPTTPARLLGLAYDYWALGHVHTRAVVHAAPWIVFPGNPQGRHIRESGPRGCMLVSADATAIETVEFVATDVARWVTLALDIAGLDDFDALDAALHQAVSAAANAAPTHLLAIRCILRGRGPLHAWLYRQSIASLRAQLIPTLAAASHERGWLEKLQVDVAAPLDLQQLASGDDPFGLLLRTLTALEADPEARDALLHTCSAELDARIDLRPEAATATLAAGAEANCASETAGTAEAAAMRHAHATLLQHARDRLLAELGEMLVPEGREASEGSSTKRGSPA